MNFTARLIPWFLLGLILLAGCRPAGTAEGATTTADSTTAAVALTTFFDLLQSGDYSEAINYYGGSFDVLEGFNPGIEPSDRATLFRNGCSINGLNCLATRSNVLAERLSDDELLFTVEFSTREGDLFILGPCCGVTETEQPPVSSFPIRVARGKDGRFRVIDLPPYTP